MQPYRPDGTIDPQDGVLLFVTSVLAGAAAGAVASIVGIVFRPLILFPLGMGYCAGVAAAAVIRKRHIRAPVVAALMGALGGLTAWSTDLGTDYVRHRHSLGAAMQNVVEQMEKRGLSFPTERKGSALNELFFRLGRGESITRDVLTVALTGEGITTASGQTIAPMPPSSALDAVRGWVKSKRSRGGTTALWILEILLAAGVAMRMAWSAAREPFCDACQNWYGPGSGDVVPLAAAADGPKVLEALDRLDAGLLARVASMSRKRTPFVGLRLRDCPRCPDQPVYVEVVDVRGSPKKNREQKRVMRRGLIPIGVMGEMLTALKNRANAPPS